MSDENNLDDFQLQHNLLGAVEVGVFVVDRGFKIKYWNRFLENHSAMTPADVCEKCLFEVFSDIDERWFRQKCVAVFKRYGPAFIIWEQRPYLLHFPAYRPISTAVEFMYQNVTVFPLESPSGEVDRICIVIYDVTDKAISKQRLQHANEQLQKMSRIDALTGLFNSYYWEEQCSMEFKRSRRSGGNSSLVSVGIDNLSDINDTYGHTAGDQVVKIMSRIITQAIRETDIAGRSCEKEFIIMLPDTHAEQAAIVAERIEGMTADMLLKEENDSVDFSVSLGIAQTDESYVTHMEWIDRACSELYSPE